MAGKRTFNCRSDKSWAPFSEKRTDMKKRLTSCALKRFISLQAKTSKHEKKADVTCSLRFLSFSLFFGQEAGNDEQEDGHADGQFQSGFKTVRGAFNGSYNESHHLRKQECPKESP